MLGGELQTCLPKSSSKREHTTKINAIHECLIFTLVKMKLFKDLPGSITHGLVGFSLSYKL